MAEDPESISKYIDGVLEETDEDEIEGKVFLDDVPSSTLKNHKYADNLTFRRCYFTADIYPQDVDMQRAPIPNELIHKAVRERGYLCDEPGFLIPVEFGGNYDFYNYFPQSKHMDTSTLENDKKTIQDYLLSADGSNRYAQMTFAFKYTENGVKWHRPTFVYYRFRLFENEKLVKEMCNKMYNVPVTCAEDFINLR